MINEIIELINKNKLLPTEITNIYKIIDLIKINKEFNQEEIKALLVWSKTILMNPFSISKFINNEDLEIYKNFLISCLNKNFAYKKETQSCIALLINNILLENPSQINELYKIEINFYYVFDKLLDIYNFYGILNQLSKLTSINLNYKKIEDSDSVLIKRYKIKIISRCNSNYLDNFNYLLKFINENDCKIGWTLSKSLFRISKHLNKKDLIDGLNKLISKPIFGDEQLWINVMTVLGFLILDGCNENMANIFEALLYDNEFNVKSCQVKETALFYCYTLLRSSKPILEYIKTIIFISLFDRNLICRRAAASIVQEYIGRNPAEFENIFLKNNNITVIDEKNSNNYSDGILLIDQNTVKRHDSCLEIFFKINDKNFYKNIIFKNISHFDRILRHQCCIAYSHFYPIIDEFNYKTVIEKDGLHLLIAEYLKIHQENYKIEFFDEFDHISDFFIKINYNEKIINNSKIYNSNLDYYNKYTSFIDFLKSKFDRYLNTFILDKNNYNIRNMNYAIESYLNLYQIVDFNLFSQNLIFLITKNYQPNFLYKIFTKFINYYKNLNMLKMSDISTTYDQKLSFIESETGNKTNKVENSIQSDIDILNTNNQIKFKDVENNLNNNNMPKIFSSNDIMSEKYSLNNNSNIKIDLNNLLKNIFNLISKNEAGILINSENYLFQNEVREKYLNNLKKRLFINSTIKAISKSKIYDQEVFLFIKSFLNDYTVDYHGDSGVNNRREAFLYLLQFNNFNLEKYILRFISDKSKKLREFIVKLIFKHLKKEIKSPQFYNNNLNDLEDINFSISDIFLNKFSNFFDDYEKLSFDFGPDECYFKSLFNNFYGMNIGFYEGIINTLSTSDSRLSEIISNLIEPYKSDFIKNAFIVVEEGLFVTQGLKFIMSYKNDLSKDQMEQLDKYNINSKNKHF